MNADGTIRALEPNETIKAGEILLTTELAKDVAQLSTRARREYYKCIKNKHSEDFALAVGRSIDGRFVDPKLVDKPLKD